MINSNISLSDQLSSNRYVRIHNQGMTVISIDLHPSKGGLLLWRITPLLGDTDKNGRLKIIGIDAV